MPIIETVNLVVFTTCLARNIKQQSLFFLFTFVECRVLFLDSARESKWTRVESKLDTPVCADDTVNKLNAYATWKSYLICMKGVYAATTS